MHFNKKKSVMPPVASSIATDSETTWAWFPTVLA